MHDSNALFRYPFGSCSVIQKLANYYELSRGHVSKEQEVELNPQNL